MPTFDPINVTRRLVGFFRQKKESTGFDKFLIGLSGGLDSAVAATIAVQALGKQSLKAVMMPSDSSDEKSLQHAKLMCQYLDIENFILPITTPVSAFQELLCADDSLRKGNIMARCRMIILFDLAAKEKALVVGTSNKSEIMLGYGTLFGDLASILNPLAGLFKTDIFKLAEYIGIPQPLIDKKPSADLWPGQTDETELGFSYAQADPILQLITQNMSSEEITESGFDSELVNKIFKKYLSNRYKLEIPYIPE